MKSIVYIFILSSFLASCAEPIDQGFVVLLDSQPKGLDPRFATSDGSAKLVGLLHAGLMNGDTKDGKPEYELAKSIINTSPMTYEIILRDDIFFHDGKPVTAADVEYTFMQLGSEKVKSPYAGIGRRIETFKVNSDTSISIKLKKPHAPFMTDLSLGIVPKHICSGHKECPGKPIGAGPFKYVAQPSEGVYTFAAFDRYMLGKPKLEKLSFRVVKDDNSRLLGLLGNSANLVQNAVAPMMLPVVSDNEKLEIKKQSSFKYTYIAFNLEHPILKNLKVREAIAHSINRESIIEYKFRGAASLSSGMLAPNHWAYNPNVKKFGLDLEKAKTLLDEAGYPDPDGDGPKTRFEFEFKVSSNKFRRALAELISNQLAQVGIKVVVRAYEWGTFFSDVKSRNFAMTTLQWPSVLEPSLYSWVFHSKNIPSTENRSAGANRGAYRNPQIDALLDAGNLEIEPEKRKLIYNQVQAILAEELPYISLWHEDNIAIMKTGSKDYFVTPNARFEALKQTSYSGK